MCVSYFWPKAIFTVAWGNALVFTHILRSVEVESSGR